MRRSHHALAHIKFLFQMIRRVIINIAITFTAPTLFSKLLSHLNCPTWTLINLLPFPILLSVLYSLSLCYPFCFIFHFIFGFVLIRYLFFNLSLSSIDQPRWRLSYSILRVPGTESEMNTTRTGGMEPRHTIMKYKFQNQWWITT